MKPVRILILALLPAIAPPANLFGQHFRAIPFPTGMRPLGVDVITLDVSSGSPRVIGPTFAAVANSGDDSVSVFRIVGGENRYALELLTTIRGIPAPYGVAACGQTVDNSIVGNRFLVSSPTDGSVTVIGLPEGRVLGRILVGPQPHAVACFRNPVAVIKGLVSNSGDSSLAVLDLNLLSVEARIPAVGGSKAFHGIGVNRDSQAWISATEADSVTVVSLTTYQVLTRIPVRSPTSVHGGCVASAAGNVIVCYDDSFRASNIPLSPSNPQDFVNAFSGGLSRAAYHTYLASTGPNNSMAYLVTGPFVHVEGTVSGIPGAAAMALFNIEPGVLVTWTFFALVTSPDSNRVFLILTAAPSPHDFSIANAASLAGSSVAAGSLVSLFGTTGAIGGFQAEAMPLPRTLGGVSVRVGGSLTYDSATDRWSYASAGALDAPLLFVGPSQVNFQMPPEISLGAVPVEVRRPDGSTLLNTIRVTEVAPGIFTVPMNGSGQGAVLNQDNSQNGMPQSIAGARAAARGSVIQIFGTGAGANVPALAAGEPAPVTGFPLIYTVAQPTVIIGGRAARVLFSGMAPGYAGLWQINAEVPRDVAPGTGVPLVVTAAGVFSNTVTIAVE